MNETRSSCMNLLKASVLMFLLPLLVAMAVEASEGSIAVVNGQAIPKSLFDRLLKTNTPSNQSPTPELEKLVKEDLINRTLLVQEAEKQGFNKTPDAEFQWAQIRDNFMVELVTKHLLEEKPITDAELRAEYDRQTAILSRTDAGSQYQIKVITVSSESEARDLLLEIKKGASFEKLAKERSIDPTKAQGGSVGWVLPGQIFAGLSSVMVNLKKGSLAAAPIQTPNGWALLKVEDVRPFKIPAFNESRNELVAAIVQARRIEYLKKLRADAEIKD